MEPLPPPDGFKSPIRYKTNKLLLLAILSIFVGLFWIFIKQLIIMSTRNLIINMGVDFAILYFSSIFVLATIVIIEIHEQVHALTLSLIGKSSTIYRLYYVKPHVKPADQWLNIRKNIVVLLSPFFVINTFGLFLAVIPNMPALNFIGYYVFSVNTIAATADITGSISSLRYPPETVIYFPETKQKLSYIYEPVE